MTIDFMDATSHQPVVLNFSIIPQWMFKTEKPVFYPADPDQVTWDYQQRVRTTLSQGTWEENSLLCESPV